MQINYFKYLKTNLWLLFGLLSFFSVAVSSIIKSMMEESSFELSYFLFNIIDWFAASIIFFFIGALIGFSIDYIVNKFSYKKIILQDWFIVIILFWIVSSITVAIYGPKDIKLVVILLFPLIYGVFFTTFAFITIFPEFEHSQIIKSIFDIILLLIFSIWLYLQIKEGKKVLKRIFLILMFIILLIGMHACAANLN